MWAYRLVEPRRLAPIELPAPSASQLPAHHVLVRMTAGGICGSDLPKFAAIPQPAQHGPPVLPGRPGFPMHEIVGEVVASRQDDLPVGSHVVGWAVRSDGLAEYVVTDGRRVARYDPQWTPLRAVLVQSIACVLHAVDRIEVAGRTVSVLGLGPIGLLFAHAARTRGARRVVGVDPVDRAQVGRQLGLDEVVTAGSDAWVAGLTDAERPQVCIEAVGHQTATLNHALHAVAPGGSILYFGIPDEAIYPVDVERLMRAHLTLIGGVTRLHREALVAADQYLADHGGLYEDLVTHVFGRDQIQDAFETAARPAPGRLKVLVDLA